MELSLFFCFFLILYSGSSSFITQKLVPKSRANGGCLVFIHHSLSLGRLIAVPLKQTICKFSLGAHLKIRQKTWAERQKTTFLIAITTMERILYHVHHDSKCYGTIKRIGKKENEIEIVCKILILL